MGLTDFLTNYLDDFLILARLLEQCNYRLGQFILLCKEIGFPLSADKTIWGCLQMVFLGILLNGQTLTLSIPLEKRLHAQQMISCMLEKKKATVKELQQLCGFLNFLNRAIFPGRAFTRRMYAKFACGKPLKQHHHIRLDQEFKFDCKVWETFLCSSSASVVNRPMVSQFMCKSH